MATFATLPATLLPSSTPSKGRLGRYHGTARSHSGGVGPPVLEKAVGDNTVNDGAKPTASCLGNIVVRH